MKMNWNPFSDLRETEHYPTARLLRSTLRQRIKDCFGVLYGSVMNEQLGVLDYIFPFARLSQGLTEYLSMARPNQWGWNMIFGLSFIPTGILNGVKFAAAALLTGLLLFPVIIPIHLGIKPGKAKLIKEIRHLEVEKGKANTKQRFDTAFNYQDIESMLIRPMRFADGELVLGLYKAIFINPDNSGIITEKGLQATIRIKPENFEGIKALLKTNSFWATKNIEQGKAFEEIVQIMEATHKATK